MVAFTPHFIFHSYRYIGIFGWIKNTLPPQKNLLGRNIHNSKSTCAIAVYFIGPVVYRVRVKGFKAIHC